MYSQLQIKSFVPVWILSAMLLVGGCSPVADEDMLPDGQYPITFTTTVQGAMQTRTTVDNTWAGTEEVTVMIEETVKKYKAESSGALTPNDAGDKFYWTNKTMTVQAWYPDTYSHIDTDPRPCPNFFIVKKDQNSGTNYQDSDMLYAIQSVTYSSGGSAELEFKHLPAKVVVYLKADTQNGVTEEEVKNATVTIVNQSLTSGAINADERDMTCTVTQVISGGGEITPKKSSRDYYQQTVQALVVPRQMKDLKFIKVKIGESIYYYTPKNDDANLKAGYRYNYDITVKKEKLEVTASSSVSWTDDETKGDAAEAVFHVTMPADHNQTLTASTNATLNSGNYDVTGSSFTLSYTVTTDNGHKGFPVVKGFCDVTRIYTTNGGTTTYTFTYSNIRSDLWLNYTEYAEVGDFYYTDGTWSAVKDDSKTCIGIVFKVHAGEGDSVANYNPNTFTDNTIHGYVVALTDAVSTECTWGKREVDTPLDDVGNKDNADYNGYGNTKKMIDTYQSDTNWDTYAAFKAIVDYRASITAPANSSNWYLPSLKQLADVYAVYQNASGNVLYDRLNSISSDYLFKEAAVGQNSTRGGYWTSTEYNGTDAWYVRFADSSGAKEAYSKGEMYIRNSFVRAILTF